MLRKVNVMAIIAAAFLMIGGATTTAAAFPPPNPQPPIGGPTFNAPPGPPPPRAPMHRRWNNWQCPNPPVVMAPPVVINRPCPNYYRDCLANRRHWRWMNYRRLSTDIIDAAIALDNLSR